MSIHLPFAGIILTSFYPLIRTHSSHSLRTHSTHPFVLTSRPSLRNLRDHVTYSKVLDLVYKSTRTSLEKAGTAMIITRRMPKNSVGSGSTHGGAGRPAAGFHAREGDPSNNANMLEYIFQVGAEATRIIPLSTKKRFHCQ